MTFKEHRRLRRAAERQGFDSWSPGVATRRATDYGCHMLTNERGWMVRGTEAPGRPELSLDDVETYLNR